MSFAKVVPHVSHWLLFNKQSRPLALPRFRLHYCPVSLIEMESHEFFIVNATICIHGVARVEFKIQDRRTMTRLGGGAIAAATLILNSFRWESSIKMEANV